MGKNVTEADLESRVDAAIRQAFPSLPADSIKHQTTFSFKFGGKTITVDGASQGKVGARSDVLIFLNEKPLAVLELKRPDVSLTKEDDQQGLSYARVLFPSPPLVLVSNGKDSRLLETHTGRQWQATDRNEKAVEALLTNAAQVAEGEVKQAVSTLMNTDPQVWEQGVRQASRATIAQLKGGWGERYVPFAEGLCLPRKATAVVQHLIKNGQRMVIVAGPPTIGKSSVLREFVEADDDAYCTLFIEADDGVSIIQSVADILEEELQWPVSSEEARRWLKEISKSEGPKLVIVIDGIAAKFTQLRAEITDLCSDTYGKSLVVVFELDETVADKVMLDSREERKSKIGRMSQVVKVKPLDNAEFEIAARILEERQIVFTLGSELAPEYRLPWVLRALLAPLEKRLGALPSPQRIGLPPVLSVHLFDIARKRLKGRDDLRRKFRGIALAVVRDAETTGRSPQLTIWSTTVFAVQRKSAEEQLSTDDLKSLEGEGWIRPVFLDTGEAIYVLSSPEMVASEIAFVIGDTLCDKQKELDGGSAWLLKIANAIPIGDLIAAQGVLDQAKKENRISMELIGTLLAHEPTSEQISIGTHFGFSFPDGTFIEGQVKDEGVVVTNKNGIEKTIKIDLDAEPLQQIQNMDAWLILSHVASVAFEVVELETGNVLGRGEPDLLLKLGSCPFVLRRPSGDHDLDQVTCHELPGGQMCACEKQGIVEMVTQSIFLYLVREGRKSESWIDEAIARDSVPLLSRLSLALRVASGSADRELAEFAETMLKVKIEPIFKDACIASKNDR